MIKTLTETNLNEMCERLAESDEDLAHIFQTYGAPPLWERRADFTTLIHLILEQQVSLASARAALEKLGSRLPEITPEAVLSLSAAQLKACYFSRQKIGYARDLASAVMEGRLDIDGLAILEDEDAKSELKKVKGIGNWTADCYLLMVLLRPDVMPKGDIALHAAYQKLKNLPDRPASDEFLIIAAKWAPYRSTAARLLWHFYLSRKK